MLKSGESGCKGCTERHVGCHSVCEKYKAWRAAYDAEKESIRQEGDIRYIKAERSRRINELRRKKR